MPFPVCSQVFRSELPKCLQFQIVRPAKISVPELDEDGAIPTEEMLDPSVLRPNKMVYFRAFL